MTDYSTMGFNTRSIHAGSVPDAGTKAIKPPLIMSNNYEMPPQFDFDGSLFIYARDGNPNQRWLEERLLALEGGEDCVVTASGVAAVSGTLFALLKTGEHVVSSDIAYISTRNVLLDYLPNQFGIQTSLVNTSDPENVRRALTPQTRLVHIETPGNPTTRISDIAAIARIAHAAGALLTVDSTWSGLTTQQPLALGADLVIHSLSKYINGHGDALGGAVLGRRDLIAKIRRFAVKDMGGCISPFNAWQIMRGTTTLALRMERHNQNALAVAEFLEKHRAVAWVRYPGLASHSEHDLAAKQMNGFGGMLNFDIKGDPSQRPEVLRRLRLFTHATCLGHEESLIMVYHDYHGQQFFRVSVGLEDATDLMADLDSALSFIEED
ncbi:MAG: aminotransferase class I/II-fold pyridoxal phosphate-dependent enzyme [Chloroflexi bacterium]|nr:aminotransferase class I/II-fold pyridoxal phosphate-dependent enzyme [Chloroflexota bacterium]